MTAETRVSNRAPLSVRFWAKVEKTDGCWLWRGARHHTGYGVIGVDRRQRRAHRVAYEMAHGPIPAGAVVCHSCDTPPCVNPSHLFVGTVADNNRDMMAKGRARLGWRYERKPHTHCRKGHAFTPETTFMYKDGRRTCRVCREANQRAYAERLRARRVEYKARPEAA
jgi:hypothetical protein